MTALAFAAAGLLVVLLALIDLFLTVFNYDGFSFIAARYQSLLWRVMQLATRPLPNRARHALLSIGSSCRPVPVRGAPADPTRRVLGRLSGPSRGPSMRCLPGAAGSRPGRCRSATAARSRPRSVLLRYRDWLGFAYRREVVLSRIAGRLGYELREATAGEPHPGTSTTAPRSLSEF